MVRLTYRSSMICSFIDPFFYLIVKKKEYQKIHQELFHTYCFAGSQKSFLSPLQAWIPGFYFLK